MPATWNEVVATQGGLAILGLTEESLIAYANRGREPGAEEPAGSAVDAASALDARGSRPTMFELAPVQSAGRPQGAGAIDASSRGLANFHADGAPAMASRSARTAMFPDTAGAGGTESARGGSRYYSSRENRPVQQATSVVIPGVTGPDYRQTPRFKYSDAVKRSFTDEQGQVLSPVFANGERVLPLSTSEHARLDAGVLTPGDDDQYDGNNPDKVHYPLLDGWSTQASITFPKNLTQGLSAAQQATLDALEKQRAHLRKESLRVAYIHNETLRCAKNLRAELRSLIAGVVAATDDQRYSSADKVRAAVQRELEWLQDGTVVAARNWAQHSPGFESADTQIVDLRGRVDEEGSDWRHYLELVYATGDNDTPIEIFSAATFTKFQDLQRKLYQQAFDIVLPGGPQPVPGARPTVPAHRIAEAASWRRADREIRDAVAAQRPRPGGGRGRGRAGANGRSGRRRNNPYQPPRRRDRWPGENGPVHDSDEPQLDGEPQPNQGRGRGRGRGQNGRGRGRGQNGRGRGR